ncbi:TonB-dependent receptor [Pedobacter caeni]|nr:TonB-dependent receptor [Pedobacter caeni]
MKKICFLIISLFICSALFAQEYRLSGKVFGPLGRPVRDVELSLMGLSQSVKSGFDGSFSFKLTRRGDHYLLASAAGFALYNQKVSLRQDSVFVIVRLNTALHQLEDVNIVENRALKRQQEESMNVETVKRDFILRNLGGSLMKSLERLPGIKTIGIGSGQSKPLIRGMGFNRVVVTDKGMKHEGQQWGADHGLEIDQFSTAEVEVIKGAASFVYGSDAIAGVIDVKSPLPPAINSLGGAIDFIGKTNNGWYGTSLNLNGRKKYWFFDSRITYQNYGDYKVPADSVYIYDYAVALNKGHLRNTAGRETDLHFSTGYTKGAFRSVLYFSNVHQKSGFFANAHGLEPRRVDAGLHDASSRDILMPKQEVNHFKLINRTVFEFNGHRLKFDLGYQHNFRQEHSNYVNHGYMPPIYPADRKEPSDLEREFDKRVYAANLSDQLQLGKHELNFGLNSEYQNNQINGWSFLVPAFRQFTAGLFVYDKYKLNNNLFVHGALRYDFGNVHLDHYQDWFLSPVGSGNPQVYQHLTRAADLKRTFNSLVYSLGINFNKDQFELKWNMGKSFRMPIPKELGANGVNYHYFSYEKGNPNLSPELSYQADLGLSWKAEKWSVAFSPFYNYFPNYIYLNPTADHDYDYGAGNQIFQYAQSRVMRYGAELQLKLKLLKNLSTEALAEYLYAKQLSGDKKGYVLPFSPPPSLLLNLTYSADLSKALTNAYFSVDYRITAKQHRIVPPEKKTEGYGIFNIQAGTKINVNGMPVSVNLQAQNLLNTKYLNHTSFYRLIELPEAGRNLILSISIPFKINKNQIH